MLPTDLSSAVARVGVDATLAPRPEQDALKRAIADRHGYVVWDVDHAGWVVDLLSPDHERFHGRTLEEALVWLMVEELGVGQPA